ncbi:MAG: hypothetical protein IT362_07155 [Deltaproteobacteria bacterium]|nr:hypothetical protein [Deltaproteobacteria bacterium]
MKFILSALFFIAMFIFIPAQSNAADPVLFFSDITSGPSTGNGDGKGSGAIVTIWGNNLGTTKGSSRVTVGGADASYVYYWGKADRTGASGPADLYTYHRMQTISFAVGSGAANGAGEIYVTVNGKRSNSLPFTVRSGNIYFVKPTGTDSASNGSWSSPWASLSYAANGGGGKVLPGDIIYATDGVQELSGLAMRDRIGTAAQPISFIAYPGANVVIQGSYGIGNYSGRSKFTNFSKFSIKTRSNGIDTHHGMRAVGNEITNYPSGCADGQGGAVSGSNQFQNTTGGNIKVFGNYIHDFGCDSTSKLHHVFYISNRGGYAVESFELGWNYLADNKAHHGLHVYDEGICGDFTGTMRIHDNVVVNQVGVAVGVASSGYSDPCFTMPVEIYNNLFINPGQETTSCSGHTQAISFMKRTTRSTIKVYNNTLYGYGVNGDGYALMVQDKGSAEWNFGGRWEWVNNIIVDTKNRPYEDATYWDAADVTGNNLYFNGGDSYPAAPPSWDSSASTANPMFIDVANKLFGLREGSPALGTGRSTTPVVVRDIRGMVRGQGRNYSIGAFESEDVLPPAAPILSLR